MSTTPSSRSSQQIRRCISRRIDLSKMGGMPSSTTAAANPSAGSCSRRDMTKDGMFQLVSPRRREQFCRQSSLLINTSSHHSDKSAGTQSTYQSSGDEADEMRHFSYLSNSPVFSYSPDVSYYEKNGGKPPPVDHENGGRLSRKGFTLSQGLINQHWKKKGMDHSINRHAPGCSPATVAAPSASRRIISSRPLLCPRSQPSPLEQPMTEDENYEESKEDVAFREKMYENATWRMYYRITSFRQARQQSSMAATHCSSIPMKNRIPLEDESNRWCERFIHDQAPGVVASSDREVCLSDSLEDEIFNMEC